LAPKAEISVTVGDATCTVSDQDCMNRRCENEPVGLSRLVDTVFVTKASPDDDALTIKRKPAHTRWDGKVSDWGFRSGDPDGPQGGNWKYGYEWWDNVCQERFDKLWAKEGDEVADDLADRYWFYWPWLIGSALATAAPTQAARVMEFAKDPTRPGPEYAPFNPTGVYDHIVTWGSFQVVRKRRNWREPSYVICPVCRAEFWNGDPRIWMIKRFGPARYCQDCCWLANHYLPSESRWSATQVKSRLRQLAEAIEAVPVQSFITQPFPMDLPDETRDRWMRALVGVPDVSTIKRVLGVSDWLGVLQATGIVGDDWRLSRGTWCRANDGHKCRSLLEKSIDDWLTSHDVAHECEPYWPAHPVLNPSGRKRADWLLADGTYVECAGMLDQPDYAAKIAIKRDLASEFGIRLVVVGPTDLHRLSAMLTCS
jgi:hypothetical protein